MKNYAVIIKDLESESIKWGINKRAKDDNASIFYRSCYGYTLDENGELTILDGEAEVVKRIFESYLSGMGSHAIKKSLENDGILSPTGKETWPKRTIEKILRNEKYCGDVVIYKTYMAEYPSTKRIENKGEKEKIEKRNHHKPIIEREKFDEVQRMMEERSRKK